MSRRNRVMQRATADQWPPVDRWPPVEGDLHAERWQHPEEGLALHSWSAADEWLPLEGCLAGLNDDDSY